MRKRLPQRMWYQGMRLVLCSACKRVLFWVSYARRVKAVQACLRDYNRPVGMAAPRLLKDPQHRLLHWIRHLHYHQQEV
jgi:hypothetical protein